MFQLPLLMPRELQSYARANDEEELLNELKAHPLDLILFFEYACDDETWSGSHPEFMNQMISWLSRKAYQGKLQDQIINRAKKAIQRHYTALKPFIPLTVTLKQGERRLKVNNLLLESASPYFRDFLALQWQREGEDEFFLDDVSPYMIEILDEYISNGIVEGLWKIPPDDIKSILCKAVSWEIDFLAEECQVMLKRYIDRANAVKTLIESHENRWLLLKNAAIDLINTLELGILFEKSPIVEELRFEFIHFKENALAVFQEVESHITHLIFGGSLIADPQFSIVVRKCPNLTGLNFSRTALFSDRLYDIPSEITELDLSSCPWLTADVLRDLFPLCPKIKKLSLASDPQLPFSAWPYLQLLRELKSLNVSRCHQITDKELRLIVRSCPGLDELFMENCVNISDRGFFDMPKGLTHLFTLSVAHCALSDSPLMEIGHFCKNLSCLDLSYCLNITDKGVMEIVRKLSFLRTLNLTHIYISEETLYKIRILNPHLTIYNR